MTSLLADLRLAARSLARAPLFTFVAIVSVALGIGANTAVFTLLDQVTLRPLPVVRPESLVQLHARDIEKYGGTMGNGTELSWPMFTDLRDRAPGVDGVFARAATQLHVSQDGASERVDGELVSGTYFPVLGVTAAVGRLFAPEDDRTPGGHPLVVLGHDYWQRRFAGRADVVGQKVLVNGQPCTIIGVAPRGFYGLEIGAPSHVYLPLTMQPLLGPAWLKMDDRRFHWVQVYARLAPGMTAERARGGLQALFSALRRTEADAPAFHNAAPETRKRFLEGRLQIEDARHGQSDLRRQLESSLQILMVVAFGVLLIACANVANLLIARGAARERELALRRALGAGRARLAWLLVAEAVVLAVIGSVLGLAIATWGAGLLVDVFATADSTAAVAASPDLRVLAFTAAVAIATALLSGLAPALRAAGSSVAPTLKAAGGGVVREQPRLRKSLVVAQVALSFLLIAAAGLFVRSLGNLQRVQTGYATERITSFSIDLDRSGYDEPRSAQFAREALQRLAAIPGVDAAGFATFGILEGGGWGMPFSIEGYLPKPGDRTGSMVNAVSPGYFETLQARVTRGRTFGLQDARVPDAGEEGWPYRTAVVNETFVKRYFGDRDPIGRHVGIGDDPGTATPIRVVGVVAIDKYQSVREEPRPQIFLPAFEAKGVNSLTVYLRSRLPVPAVLASARAVVAQLDPALPVYNVATLEERVQRSLRNERLVAGLSAAFATLATLLAVIGLYGVMSYTVTRQSREIGIRMALGARAGRVALQVVREAGLLVGLGLAAAIPAAWWFKGFVGSELYNVQPLDPATLALAATGLAAVALLAAGIPARRAAHVDPMRALRDD